MQAEPLQTNSINLRIIQISYGHNLSKEIKNFHFSFARQVKKRVSPQPEFINDATVFQFA